MLHEMMGRATPPDHAFGGPAYTLSVPGTEFLFRVGARVRFPDGSQRAPVEAAIGSDSRNPAAKRRILELYAEHGYEYPDTPTMAFHRGRFDLLEAALRLRARSFLACCIGRSGRPCLVHRATVQGIARPGAALVEQDDVPAPEHLVESG